MQTDTHGAFDGERGRASKEVQINAANQPGQWEGSALVREAKTSFQFKDIISSRIS